MRKIAKILIDLALFVMNSLRLIGVGLAGFFAILAKPLSFFAKFFYYLLVLPTYRFYLLLTKRAGFSKSQRQRLMGFLLLNKRLIHIITIVMTVVLVYENFNAANKDLSSEEVVGKTLLAKLISDEFVTADQLIEEGRNLASKPGNTYMDSRLSLEKKVNLYTKEAPDDSDVDNEYNDVLTGPNETELAKGRVIPTRSETVSYTVAEGDTISTIARKFGVSVSTIQWENNLNSHSYIRPGDKLSILPMTGVSHKVAKGETLESIAKKYDVDAQEVSAANRLSGGLVKLGQKLVIPDGQPLDSSVPGTTIAKRTETTVSRATRTTVASNSDSGRASVSSLLKRRDDAKPIYGAKMNWPTTGYRITQYYSWRHNGLDIADHVGTPIFAADAGVVELVGWNRGGYGNQIVINHGGGRKTRYAHLSGFAVKVGQEVSKGEYIAAMGNTGRSTGPHLHFEVMINNARYNPLNYVNY